MRAWPKSFEPAFGARPLRRVIRTALEDELAREVLFGKLRKGGTAIVDVDAPESCNRARQARP